jgi:hypothetical protein
MRLPLFSLLFFSAFRTEAVEDFIFSQNCKEAYKYAYELRFSKAQSVLDDERKINPENSIVDYIEYNIFFLRTFISEEERDFKNLKEAKNKLMERLKDSDASSPYRLLCEAEANLMLAFNRIKFKEYVTGGYEIHRAYRLLTANKEKFPAFYPTLKGLGFLHAIIGSVPEEYKWLAKIAGMKGTIQQGLDELKTLMERCKTDSSLYYLFDETRMLSVYLEHHLRRDSFHALQLISNLDTAHHHPMKDFFVANIFQNTGKSAMALKFLECRSYPPDAFPVYYLEFIKGSARLYALDFTAEKNFKTYVEKFRGRNFIKASYQKLAWINLLKGDTNLYRYNLGLAKKLGTAFTDEDKQSLKEAEGVEIPNVQLLRSRLLFDGGFYSRALAELAVISPLTRLRDQLELTYRLSRIYDKMNNKIKATEYYEMTIRNGESFTWYFAANSALHLAQLYERSGNREKAIEYFRKCLSMRRHEYQNSIDQKAEAGLNRLGAK